MKKQAIKLIQDGLEFYITKLNVEELIENSYIEFFNSETEEGYQRPLNTAHVKSIVKYLINANEPIMASAIIAAVDENTTRYDENHSELDIRTRVRIVDGQHRIEAFKMLKNLHESKYKIIKDFEYPVVLLKIGNDQKIHEINAFIDLNKKGKKVSTDLALRLQSKIRQQVNEYSSFEEIEQEVAQSIAKYLNKDENSIWFDAIKDSPEKVNKIISLNAFSHSLIPIIKVYKKFNLLEPYEINNEKIVEISLELNRLIFAIWKIIEHKWPECFINQISRMDKAYSIQKGLGVNTLHLVVASCYEKCKGNIENTLLDFEKIIINSSIEYFDWKSGGKFSGYSSSAGFRELSKKVIENQPI